MKRLLSFTAACFLALAMQASFAFAQSEITDSHLEAGRKVVISSGMSRSFDIIIPNLQEMMRRQMVTNPTAARELEEVFKTLEPEMDLQRRAMVTRAGRLMAQRMTEEELTAIAAFFETPEGRRYVEVQPLVVEDILGTMDVWAEEVAEYLQVRVRVEMQQRGVPMP